ncbi:hypothetical protein [Xenorhabdus bovienii]|uniref:hypothetical protein n=1 Tax=Xenorhabdus bovienii TaxID=40576 RepID=UPI0023B29D03|nr:hypothetical protein [Xenorhabdus bovienii]
MSKIANRFPSLINTPKIQYIPDHNPDNLPPYFSLLRPCYMRSQMTGLGTVFLTLIFLTLVCPNLVFWL